VNSWIKIKLEAKDVLPNINRTQAAPEGPKMPFLSLATLTFDLDFQTRPKGIKYVFRVNLAQIRLAIPEIFHKQTKKSQRQKQYLTQFTACGNQMRYAASMMKEKEKG